MTKFVVSGYIGFDNFGDEAICGILTKYLRDNNAEKITVISLNPEKTSRLYWVHSCKMLDFIKPINEADVLISGGGSLLQDITSLKSLLYYLIVITTALVFNKKVIIFAQGFTPFRTKIGELLTKLLLKRCHLVTVRDKASQKFLENLGIKSELIYDPVFEIETPNIVKKNGVGIQLRRCRYLTDEFMYFLATEIASRFKNKEIKLFSMQDSEDLPVIEHFASMLAGNGVIARIYMNMSVPEAIEEISKLEYLIGMRFHANLIAAKAGVKVLGINYDVKVKNLAESVGFPVINMFGCEVSRGMDELTSMSTYGYNIPKFTFPNLFA